LDISLEFTLNPHHIVPINFYGKWLAGLEFRDGGFSEPLIEVVDKVYSTLNVAV
jgi:hypothetical protein